MFRIRVDLLVTEAVYALISPGSIIEVDDAAEKRGGVAMGFGGGLSPL